MKNMPVPPAAKLRLVDFSSPHLGKGRQKSSREQSRPAAGTEKNIDSIVTILKKNYGSELFAEVNEREPYKVLVSCILSLRTKDETSYPASGRLFRLAQTPKAMVKLTPRQIQKAIYPVCFYRVKSKTILGISKRLLEEYGGKVPGTIDELLKFKGVGRKTANIVVTYGFNKPGIAVDTHVHRISNRLGLVKTKNPDETEFCLRKTLDQKYWIPINELLVRHGQAICKPISPMCSKCLIREYCKRVGVGKSR
jgi:endonuclease-3